MLKYTTFDKLHDGVQRLINRTAAAALQRSDDWLARRKGYLTASDIATALVVSDKSTAEYLRQFPTGKTPPAGSCCNPYSNLQEFMLRKCGLGPAFHGNEATQFGTTFEPAAQRVYERSRKVDLLEFGLVVDPDNDWLAASPDGVSTDGVMLEIKIPLRREPSAVPPLNYWHQMQVQMQVCDLDFCDYVCCDLVEFLTVQSWKEHHDARPETERYFGGALMYGAIAKLPGGKQLFPPDYTDENIEQIEKWASSYPDVKYYGFKAIHVSRVDRSRAWFESNRDDLVAVWETMRAHQKAGGKQLLDETSPPLAGGVKTPIKRKPDGYLVMADRPCLF